MTLGLPPAEFWDITLREADVILRAAAERHHNLKVIEDGRVYSLAVLMSFAVNDPKNMPKMDKVFPSGRPKKPKTPEQMVAALREWSATMDAIRGVSGG